MAFLLFTIGITAMVHDLHMLGGAVASAINLCELMRQPN